MRRIKLGVVVGSLRNGSYSRAIANHLSTLLSLQTDVQDIDIGLLPIYHQDLDAAPPPEWVEFRARVRTLDAVLFVTPEYNRSVPPILKNALDVASRPHDDGAWSGKPAGVVSVSPGPTGGYGAHQHLRQILMCVNMPVLPQPEMYIGNVSTLLTPDGAVQNERTKQRLEKFAEAFVSFALRHVADVGNGLIGSI